VILIDAGPLVALVNARDQDHVACAFAAKNLADTELVTTWPCFTEAMYLLYREGGLSYQEALWQLRASGILSIHATSIEEERRMRKLMTKYADSPMDLADASLVAAADALRIQTVFTIDGHFHAYRLSNGKALLVVP